jgi:hypothetical protein
MHSPWSVYELRRAPDSETCGVSTGCDHRRFPFPAHGNSEEVANLTSGHGLVPVQSPVTGLQKVGGGVR